MSLCVPIVRSYNLIRSLMTYIIMHLVLTIGNNVDFNSTTQNVIITAGTNSSTVNIAIINDDIVEGDENFTMSLNVPVSPGILAGSITMTTGIIFDTSSELWHPILYRLKMFR